MMTLSPRLVTAFPALLRTLGLLALLCVAMLPTSHAWAQEGVATVRLDGRALFRIGPHEELEARPRARQIERQLAAVLETPKGITKARIEPTEAEDDDGLQISVAGRPLMVVAPADAEANGQPLDRLARDWAAILDRALATAAKRRDSDRGRFITSVQSSVENAFARLLESAINIIPRVLAALLVLLLFWGLATAVRALMKKIVSRLANDLTVENLVRQVSYYAIWVLGIIVAASAFGLEPSTLATGLGLTSLALGFALKDILSNFVSGLLILTLRPFQLGDQIIIGETEGSVERIELRATQIRTYDGRRVLVPNAETFTSRVTNNTAARSAAARWSACCITASISTLSARSCATPPSRRPVCWPLRTPRYYSMIWARVSWCSTSCSGATRAARISLPPRRRCARRWSPRCARPA